MKLEARLLALALAALGIVTAAPADAAHRHHARASAPSFPMKSADYKQLVEKRVDHVRAVIDKKLDRAGVSADRKKAIHKILDEEAKDLRAEVARVSADGTVTEAEAAKVKPLTMGLRARVRERLRAEKNPKAKATLAAIRAKEAKEKAAKLDAEKAAKQRAEREKAQKAADAAKEKTAKEVAAKQKAMKQAAAKQKAAKAAKQKAAKHAASKVAKAKPAKATKPAVAKKLAKAKTHKKHEPSKRESSSAATL